MWPYYYFVIICFSGPSALHVVITRNIVALTVFVQWDVVDDSRPINYIVVRIDNVYIHVLVETSPYRIGRLGLNRVSHITVTAANGCGTGPEYSTSVSFPAGTYVHSTCHYF